jgi:hypothetical protein
MSEIMTVTSTLVSGAVVTFDAWDTTANDVDPFPIGDYFQRIVGGSGNQDDARSPLSVATAIVIPQATAAGT